MPPTQKARLSSRRPGECFTGEGGSEPTIIRFTSVVVILLFATPLAVEAQQAGRVWRIGVLAGSPPTTPEAARPWEALLQGLREHGYIEGQNLVRCRWAAE